MEQRIFSFGIKEQLMVMLQNVNDVNKRAHPQCSGVKRMCDSTKHNGLITLGSVQVGG